MEEYKKHSNTLQINLKELSYSIDPKESWANSINKFSLKWKGDMARYD